MVAKGTQDRHSSSSANATTTPTTTTIKRRVLSASQDKKKNAKPIGICGFCLGDNQKNANGVPERMIHCAECGNSGHPSCLQYSDTLVKKIRKIRWQCIDCKRCIVCDISDDSLLFCDFCDSGIHPKCCNPPLTTIPKGDFACHLCHDELPSSPKTSLIKTVSSSSSSSIRSRRSNNDDETSTNIAQVSDEMSNIFVPNKPKSNHIRQQSVQKAMKYLREKKTIKSSNKKMLKRLQSSRLNQENNDLKDNLLAKDILDSSKTQRIRKKLLNDDLSSNPQTSTPLLTRQSSNKKLINIEPITPRNIRRSDVHPIEDLNKSNKRKHSTNSLSPISNTSSVIIKKRAKNDSPSKKHQNKRKQSQTEDDHSDDDQKSNSTLTKRKLNLDLSQYKNPPAFLNDSLPDNVVENDIYLFLESRKNSTKLITDCSDKFHHSSESIDDDTANNRWPPYIVLGSELIKTWYSSSYPQEYARVPRLYICEFCLKYMKCEQVYDRHRIKCTAFHPPANEIYHKDDLSVFEVDGNTNRIYCQNLCLLAKLFLNHKTLYYDVEPFLFYVLTKNDSNGCHFIGYFSKEKHCPQKYNLSCITVLPICQRRGYGRFLIELSYLISQKEGLLGTPERPLSTLGAQTYEAYWKIKIVQQLIIHYNENNHKCLLKSIMNETGMAIDDIIDTLQNLGVLTMKSNGKPVITADVTQLETIMKNEKIKHAHWVSIDSEYLRFTPVLTPLLLANEEKAVEKQVKEIQIVFKEIGREAAEAASLAPETADGKNPNGVVRYIRRRKFGHKRRSIIVQRRTIINNKPNKNESLITHDDSCVTDIITNDDDDDEHSQVYVPRRRISTINESIKEEQEQEQEEENKIIIPKSSSPKLSLKQPILKQLKLDQFLKVVQPTENSLMDEKPKLDQNGDIKNDNNNEEIYPHIRRINRHTRLHSTSKSEADPIKTENEIPADTSNKPDFDHQDSLTIQTCNEGLSPASSTDSSTTTNIFNSLSISNIDQPITLKKRNLTSPDIQALIDDTISPPKDKIDQPILSHEMSLSSINGTDDETKIIRIENRLTSIISNDQEEKQILSINSFNSIVKPVESTDDEQPPSLTSPTSMIVSQSDHYNYSTRGKQQQQQQNITINNFNTSTNMTYNYGNMPFTYPYPPPPSTDMQPLYYPPTTSMDYIPYYPTPLPSNYPPVYNNTLEQQSLYYPSNGVDSISYNSNGTTPYVYPTAQPSSTVPTTQRH